MALGGTTALPAPYPTIGVIRLDSAGTATADSLVTITFSQSPDKAVIWSLKAGDITAIEERETLLGHDADGKLINPDWHVGSVKVLEALSADESVLGIAYVREETQVLLRLEYGLSAVDSVGVALSRGTQRDGDISVTCKPCCRH